MSANTSYGVTPTTFELQTEEKSIRWSFPIDGDQAVTGLYTWNAGDIAEFSGTGKEVKKHGTGTDLPIGVFTEDRTTTLDETRGRSKVTVVCGPHIGKTKQIDSSITTSITAGTPLYASGVTAGAFGTGSNGQVVGYAISYDGTWLLYVWSLVVG